MMRVCAGPDPAARRNDLERAKAQQSELARNSGQLSSPLLGTLLGRTPVTQPRRHYPVHGGTIATITIRPNDQPEPLAFWTSVLLARQHAQWDSLLPRSGGTG